MAVGLGGDYLDAALLAGGGEAGDEAHGVGVGAALNGADLGVAHAGDVSSGDIALEAVAEAGAEHVIVLSGDGVSRGAGG